MINFVLGGLTAVLAYVFYSIGKEDEVEEEIHDGDEDGIVVKDSSGRLHTLYCETCRKKKKHREIQSRVFECTRCHRTTDLRIPL